MSLVIAAVAEAACARAAELVAALLAARPAAVLALPVGAHAAPVYAELRRRHRAGALSFARATTFSLDEYVGITPDNPRSFHHTLRDELYDHVDLRPEHIQRPTARPPISTRPPPATSRRSPAPGASTWRARHRRQRPHRVQRTGSPFASRTRVVALAADDARRRRAVSAAPRPCPRTR